MKQKTFEQTGHIMHQQHPCPGVILKPLHKFTGRLVEKNVFAVGQFRAFAKIVVKLQSKRV